MFSLFLAAVAFSAAFIAPRTAVAFSCDSADGDPTAAARALSDDAFDILGGDGWRRDEGVFHFTHDHDAELAALEETGTNWNGIGNPAMIYARPSFSGGISPVFRLGPSDALVMTFCAPPPSRYFSASTYVWRRRGRVVSATAGNNRVNMLTLRNSTWNHACDAELFMGERCPVFSKPIVLVSTKDELTFERVSEAFLTAGIDEVALNVEELAPDRIMDSDQLTFSFRSAMWPGNDALGEYSKLRWNSVFIARAPRNFRGRPFALKPQPSPSRLMHDERHLQSSLYRRAEQLKRVLVDSGLKYMQTGKISTVNVDRDRCLTSRSYSPFRTGAARQIRIQSACFGETSDCAYGISDLALPDRPFVALFVGVNHVAKKNAMFSNIAAYQSGGATSFISAANVRVVSSVDDRAWGTDLVYAHAFASGGLCRYFAKGWKTACTEVPSNGQESFFITRDYLDPNSATAPNSDEMINPMILYFAS